jgi:anaerobic selenocysteine-containing dehydrogenase
VDVNSAAAACDLSVQELTQLARIFATAERPLAIPGNMLTGQDNAVQAVSVVQALNLVAGTAGQTGGISISSGSPLPGLVKPVFATYADVQGLIQRMRYGDIKVLLVHGANPAYELAEQTGLLEALGHVPFVVSFSPIVDETAVQSDLVLPDRTYLEAWGYEVVSPSFGVPVASSQQPVAPPVFDARSTGDVMLAVAQGIEPAAKALPWADEVAFIKEMVAKLPTGAEGGSGADVLWARFLQHGGWWPATFSPPSLSTPTLTKPIQITLPRQVGSEQEYPYFLHIYLSDLLSDGRGASLPWLQGSPDPMTTVAWQTWVELYPATAQKLGLQDGDVVRVTSPYGQIEAPVYTFPAIRPDTIAIPLGQGHTDCGRYARERGSNAMQLVGGDLNWAAVRIKISNTGKRVPVAMFESKTGVTRGFINQSFPGQ